MTTETAAPTIEREPGAPRADRGRDRWQRGQY
jgi:hypothetical protein